MNKFCYIVVSKRKSDGKMFFPGRGKTYDNVIDANEEAEGKAKYCSDNYIYVVCQVEQLFGLEKEILIPEYRIIKRHIK